MIGAWLAKRHKAKLERMRKDGFNFAAGAILIAGDDGIAKLEAAVECARDFGTFDEFDCGILDAIAKHRERSNV